LVCLLSAQEKKTTVVAPILGSPPRLRPQRHVIGTLSTQIVAAALLLIQVTALLFADVALITAPQAFLSGRWHHEDQRESGDCR
jgi:hypothetical protein